MLSKVYSYGLSGLDIYPVTIEVDVSRGLPCCAIVGLPDNAVKESKERVRSAIKNSGYQFPQGRITINLSPADVKKEGPCFDLPIALGLLTATQQIMPIHLKRFMILGELSLDGHVQSINGTVCIALSVPRGRFQGIIVPRANAQEAAITNHIDIHPVKTLAEAIQILQTPEATAPFKKTAALNMKTDQPSELDFSDVHGQLHAKRGLEIAAAGGHNAVLIGPPGSGKTMLAKRLPTILPAMSPEESLAVTKIYSMMGLLDAANGVLTERPFRSPHHTSSSIALVGGGSIPRPGEVTLAHHGVLFLDELAEFNRDVLESLRQPLEDQYVTVARAAKTMRFPSQFMLIGAMNPCHCGFLGVTGKDCQCSSFQIQKYLSKISGPLLDRIDIHLEVPPLPPQDLISDKLSETSQTIKTRTTCARDIQKDRLKNTSIFCNAQMSHRQIRHYCEIITESKNLLTLAIKELNLSARAYDKILKVARTIADLDGSESIRPEHIAEAIQYRSLDRNSF